MNILTTLLTFGTIRKGQFMVRKSRDSPFNDYTLNILLCIVNSFLVLIMQVIQGSDLWMAKARIYGKYDD